jgi:hypothetical protein
MNIPSGVCCAGLSRRLIAAVAVLVAVTGGFAAGRWSAPPQWVLPERLIDAAGGVTSDEFSMSTGMVGNQAEGLFILDHASGLLQCAVLYPRAGTFGAIYQANVQQQLASGGRNSKYLLITGTANFPGGGNQGLGPTSVAYVLDSSTGAFAAYAVPFDRTMANSNNPQQGALMPIASGQARGVAARDR